MDMSLKNYKILVTGGAGFIGSHLVEKLVQFGAQVSVIDNFSTGKRENLASVEKLIDIRDVSLETCNLTSFDRQDVVFHLAAQAAVPLSISDFEHSSLTNLHSSLRVINYCVEHDVPLVYASSSAIYGNLPMGDDTSDRIDLLSPYAADKLMLEHYTHVQHTSGNLSSIGLRFFNVYGPKQDPNNPYSGVISVFFDRVARALPINVHGGKQTRDFIYIADVVNCLVSAAIKSKAEKICEICNVLTGCSETIEDLANFVMASWGRKVDVSLEPYLDGDPHESNGTIEKMEQLLDVDTSSLIDLKGGIQKMKQVYDA